MHHGTIHIQPVGFSPIGFAQAAGMPGDIRIDFRTQSNQPYTEIAGLNPQLVLKPFHMPVANAYDIVIDDPTQASGLATIPGPVMNDRFRVEVYTRNASGNPQRMIAAGRVDLSGDAYQTYGPLSPASYPAGPAGPPGPMGPAGLPGVRGSRWYTGAGAPASVPGTRVDGDMWLDEATGDVWRWDGGLGAWTAYRGNRQ